jgi:hypothetical protein
MIQSTSCQIDLFHHIQELKIMKTLIQKAVKILFILMVFISLSDKNYAQRTQVIDFPTTDPNNLDLMLLGTPWKVPEKVVSVKIQAWGSGGAGGGGTNANGRGGGGGGGGAYVEFVQTAKLTGTWWFLCGPGPEGINGRLKHGEGSWVNFHGQAHPSDILNNGVEAHSGDGGDKADGKVVVPGGGGGQEAATFFPNWGGYGGLVIPGTDGDESSATSSGKGGNSLAGGAGGAAVPSTGGRGRNGIYPGGGGSGAFVNNNTLHVGGNGADGKLVFTITFIDPPTASSQTLCFGSTISNLVTSNTFSGATIKWYEQAAGGTPLAPTTVLTTKTYYVSQTWRAENGDADVESDRTAVAVTITPTPGTISGAAVVCTGTSSTTLTLNGNIGTVQWQFSTDGTNFSNIANATRQAYTFTNLTTTTHYRAVVTGGSCGTATTAPASIIVKQPGSWIGAVNNDWNNAGNWCGSMPTASTNVTISSEPSNQPFIDNADVSVRSLTIAPGAQLTINSNKNLSVFGNWFNNGTFTANAGTVTFKGITQVIGGTNVTTFNDISIEGGGSKILSKNIEVKGSVSFNSGYIVSTNSSTLTFKAGSRIAKEASDASFAKVLVIKYGTTDFEFPVGSTINGVNRFRPIEVSDLKNTSPTDYFKAQHFAENPLEAFQLFGSTIFKDESTQTLSSISNLEFWNLSRSNPNSIADVTMDYSLYPTSAEKAQSVRLAHYDENEFVWENAPTDFGNKSVDVVRKKLKVTKVKNFSPFTTADINLAALPVTLSSFTAKPTPDNKVSLSWVTSSEIVNKGFRIERQVGNENGKFEQIGFVASKAKNGNSQNTLAYNFIDAAPKVGSASFYRLVQEDLDRKLTYSEVRVVKLNGQSVSMVFPNPSNGAVTISRTADGKKMNVQVIDQSGKIISQANNITDANYRLNIPQSGVYTIKMIYPETGEQSTQRVVVQK